MHRGIPWKRVWRDCTAAEIAEAAFVLPLLFMFVLGIFQFSRVFLMYSTLQRAAQDGARAAAGSPCATCGGIPLTGAQVATQVIGPILQNAHIDATVLTAPASPTLDQCPFPPAITPPAAGCEGSGTGATPKVCVQRNVILNNAQPGGAPTGGSPVCGTLVRLVYPYSFSLPVVTATAPYMTRQTYTLSLKAQAQVKDEE